MKNLAKHYIVSIYEIPPDIKNIFRNMAKPKVLKDIAVFFHVGTSTIMILYNFLSCFAPRIYFPIKPHILCSDIHFVKQINRFLPLSLFPSVCRVSDFPSHQQFGKRVLSCYPFFCLVIFYKQCN